MLLFALCFASLVLLATGTAFVINAESPIQAATVLTSTQLVDDITPSPFFGLVHMSFAPSFVIFDGYEVNVTVWHNNPFATSITLNGNATSTRMHDGFFIDNLYNSAMPNGAAAENCPQQTTLHINAETYALFAAGLLYVQITSLDVDSNFVAGGQLRGQLEERFDVLVGFIGPQGFPFENVTSADNLYDAAQGMVLAHLTAVDGRYVDSTQHINFASYVITTLPPGTILQASYFSADAQQLYLANLLWFVQDGPQPYAAVTNGTVPIGEALQTGDMVGERSSPLFILGGSADNLQVYGHFVRMPLNDDAIALMRLRR